MLLVQSGGNIDFPVVDGIIRKGLVTSVRVAIFDVSLSDLTGSLSAVTGIIAAHRANILDVAHDRMAGGVPLGRTRVAFTAEIRRGRRLEDVLAGLRESGYETKEKA